MVAPAETKTTEVARLVYDTRFEDLPAQVVDYSKSLALSALGGMVAGSVLPSSRTVADYVRRMGGNPEALVACEGFRTCVENAALANAHFAHTSEYEDDSMPEGVSSYTLFPPILALGEKLGSPGSRLLESFVVGYEVQSRLGLDGSNARRRGYLNLSLMGVLGVAAAASKLLGLTVGRTTMALSLAASMSCGLTRQTGSDAHFFEMGVAARDGLAAALLAAEGLTGSSSIFEGTRGFLDLKTAGTVTEPSDALRNWGAPYRVMAVGIKSYPCCYHMQRFIQATVDLKKAHGLRAEDVAGVELEVNPMVPQFVRYHDPADGNESKFSMPHGVAVALLDDRITMASFSDERVRDRAVREMRERVKVVVHEDWEYGSLTGPYPLSLVLRDGRRLTTDCTMVRGQPPDLLPVERVIDKYRLCTDGLLAREKVEQSIEMVLGLERLDDAAELARTIESVG